MQYSGVFECGDEKGSVVVPVDTSMMVDDYLGGSEIIRTRVGDVYVAEGIKQCGAIYGGEPSGSWIFPKISYCPDGIYAAAKLVEIVREKKLSELRQNFRPTLQREALYPVQTKRKPSS